MLLLAPVACENLDLFRENALFVPLPLVATYKSPSVTLTCLRLVLDNLKLRVLKERSGYEKLKLRHSFSAEQWGVKHSQTYRLF